LVLVASVCLSFSISRAAAGLGNPTWFYSTPGTANGGQERFLLWAQVSRCLRVSFVVVFFFFFFFYFGWFGF
jgi:hypothetical protein